MDDDRFPHFIVARNLIIGESITKDPTQLPEFSTFYDANRLKTCERVKECEIIATYLIICDYEPNEMVQEYPRRECRDVASESHTIIVFGDGQLGRFLVIPTIRFNRLIVLLRMDTSEMISQIRISGI